MSTIVTRYGKGSPLTWLEVDNNFTNLNTDKIQSGDTVASLTITSATINGGTITGITDLAVADGGTGLSSLTAGYIPYGAGTSAFASSSAFNYTSSVLYTPSASLSGNLTFTGTGNRITGDFSNATIANRVIFQTSTTNSNTTLSVMPNGTATIGALDLYNSSDLTNANRFRILAQSGENKFFDTPVGTASYLPMTFYTSNLERMRIDTSGNVGIGTTPYSSNYRITSALSGASTQGIGLSVFNSTDGFSSGVINIIKWGSTATTYGTYAANNVGINTAYTNFNIGTETAHPLVLYTYNVERMRIDSSGNVGIGTTSVSNFGSTYRGLEVKGSDIGFIQASGGATSTTIEMMGAGNIGYLGTRTNHPLAFRTYDTERMRIDSSGNVGIGTTSPQIPLDVVANTSSQAIRIRGRASDNLCSYIFDNNTGSAAGNVSYIQGLASASGYLAFATINTERMRIDSAGLVGIGTSSPSALLTLAAGTATANTSPLKFTSGTNLTTPEAGSVEYDGTIITATTNTSFKRGTIPITNYASGTGTTLGTNTEATLAVLLPAANDTITLPIGTYFLDTSFIITRGSSTTSATARLNILGTGNAVGSFSGMSLSAPTAGGATANFSFDGVNINVSNVLTAASTTSGGVYQITLRGMLKVTTAGTIVPQYNLSANINGAGTVAKVLYFRLQQLDTQSAAAFGPAGTGWA